jgi:hypothetical protein
MYKNLSFLYIIDKFLNRDINPYLFLNTKPHLLWCPDAFHLLKLSRYRVVGNILSMSFNIDKKLNKIKELKNCSKILIQIALNQKKCIK